MALTDRIQADLVAAMRARDSEALATLRMVLSGLKTAKVAAGRGDGDLSDAEAVEVLTREAKRRSEAAEVYDQAGRGELADKERRELEIIRAYLPAQLDDSELAALVDEAIAATGATAASDLGRVMSAVMPKVKGRADGKQVNSIVRERLGA